LIGPLVFLLHKLLLIQHQGYIGLCPVSEKNPKVSVFIAAFMAMIAVRDHCTLTAFDSRTTNPNLILPPKLLDQNRKKINKIMNIT